MIYRFKTLIALLLALSLLAGCAAMGEELILADGATVEPAEDAPDLELGDGDISLGASEDLLPDAIQLDLADALDAPAVEPNDPDSTEFFFYMDWLGSTFGKDSFSIPVGREMTLYAYFSEPWNTLTWAIEDETVAEVAYVREPEKDPWRERYDGSCSVLAKAAGTTRITATGEDGRSCSAELVVVEDEGYLPIDATHFPDAHFRSELQRLFEQSQDYPFDGAYRNGELSKNAIPFITLFDTLNSKEIQSLGGIEVFTALQTLFAPYNDIQSLDATKLKKLKYLECYNNDLTDLKVAGLSELDTLVCHDNEIKKLDLTGCNNLKGLDCSDNQIGTLDVSDCPDLVELLCEGNDMTSVDISGCDTLIRCFEEGELTGSKDSCFEYTVKTEYWYDYHLRVDPACEVIYGGVSHRPGPEEPEETPAPTVTPAPTAAPEETVAPGMTVETKSGTYKVNRDLQAVLVKGPKGARKVVIPAQISVAGRKLKVVEIGSKAFYKNKTLSAVTVGKNVKTVGASAFAGCAKLKTVKGGAAVKAIGASAFKGCKALTAITLGAKVETLGKSAFYGCGKLKTVTIKSTKLKSVGKSAFKGIYAKATFKCPKKKLAAYKKLIVKAGAPKKAVYKS